MEAVVLGGHAAFIGWIVYRRRARSHADDHTLPLPLPNPYLSVIDALSTQAPLLLPSPSPPPPLASSPWAFVDTPAALDAAAARLAAAPRLALDIEHHAQHSYAGTTCLLQLSTGGEEVLIDALAPGMRAAIAAALGPLLADPAILKVVHGGGSDVQWLLRDFGARLVNVFDTEAAARAAGRAPGERSLKALLAAHAGVDLDKSLQTADWRRRPLPPPWVSYARADVHYLLFLADVLGAELAAAGGGPAPRPGEGLDPESPLGRAVRRSQALSVAEHAPPRPRAAASAAAAAAMKAHVAGLRAAGAAPAAGPLPPHTAAEVEGLGPAVHALCVWRDGVARALDDGVGCVLPDGVALALAEEFGGGGGGGGGDGAAVAAALRRLGADPRYAAACRFPQEALAAAGHLEAELAAAAAGRRPWAHPDVAAALRGGPDAAKNGRLRPREDREALRERLGQRFGAKKAVYENCRMLSRGGGDLLCFTDRKRLEWYVRKGLAVEDRPGAQPYTVRLTFDHKEEDQAAGAHAFYSAARANACVGCGAGRHYLRYRVVPACYRRALPERFKSHRSHDVVLLCVACHEAAQRACEAEKRRVAVETGVPLIPPALTAAGRAEEACGDGDGDGPAPLPHPYSVRKAALALQRAAATMPDERVGELRAMVAAYVRGAEPWAAALPPDAPLGDDEIWAGLLAGMARPTRRKTIRRWVAQGAAVPAALAAEVSPEAMAAAAAAGSQRGEEEAGAEMADYSVYDPQRDALGHAWHGRRVVAAAVAAGGDAALASLCARFRSAFVAAVRPRHLPPGWRVDHAAPRSFGQHSAFAGAGGGGEGESGDSGSVGEGSGSEGGDDFVEEEEGELGEEEEAEEVAAAVPGGAFS